MERKRKPREKVKFIAGWHNCTPSLFGIMAESGFPANTVGTCWILDWERGLLQHLSQRRVESRRSV
jgi:hypothetical protein